jgi:hypothetical protein
MRFVLRGIGGAPKGRQDLIQANIGPSGMVTLVASAEGGTRYTVRRALKQSAVLLGGQGQTVSGVDIDRGTFLPLDVYTGPEIEAIADETLGEKRRSLLDDLKEEELRLIKLAVSDERRALDANADRVRALRTSIQDLKEQIEELGDASAQLTALGPLTVTESSAQYIAAVRQEQCNKREIQRNSTARDNYGGICTQAASLKSSLSEASAVQLVEPGSSNEVLTSRYQAEIQSRIPTILNLINDADDEVQQVLKVIDDARRALDAVHAQQAAQYSLLQQENNAASELVRRRADLEQKASRLTEIQQRHSDATTELAKLVEQRKRLKADFLASRDRISNLRDAVGRELQSEAGEKVRIRVLRNADDLAYQTMLIDGLKGARVRGHEDILAALLRLRPEQLAQIVQTNDCEGLDELVEFGEDRCRKILDAFRSNLDPLKLEIVEIEDRVKIELNVSTGPEPLFKDAADLSRGQKCTALLPILLARRESPLIIDQPEDNLDNHFIYETVVNSIRRLKAKRQMVFITHNANIPVLAEAELIVVLNSDGKIGFVEKQGSIDECRDEIVDLLEGGEEAFELRRKRYGRL